MNAAAKREYCNRGRWKRIAVTAAAGVDSMSGHVG